MEETPRQQAVRALVSGRVQGVGFRWFVLRQARRSGVAGDVRNLADGRVEVRARGTAEGLEQLLGAVREGPPGARVDDLETRELDPALLSDGFDVRH